MLLKEILKNTWDDHEDFPHVKGAVDMVQEVSVFLNESKRIFEQREELLEKLGHIIGDLEVIIFYIFN